MMKRQGLALGTLFLVGVFLTISGGGCDPETAPPGITPEETLPEPDTTTRPSDPGSTSPPDERSPPGTTPPPGGSPDSGTGSPPEATPTADAGTSLPPQPEPVPGTEPEPPSRLPPALPGYGANLLLNPNAEESRGSLDEHSVPVPHWTLPPGSELTAVQYNASGFPASDQGPPDPGHNFFAGGQALESSAYQDIDVARMASEIDEGSVKVGLSGFLGGHSRQEDSASVTAQFRTADGRDLGSLSIGPVTASDRLYITGLLSRKASTPLPVGTRSIRVVLRLVRAEGTYNDGYADNLLLVLTR